MSAWLGSQQISHITQVSLNGSSSLITHLLPKSIGAILHPSGNATRSITLECAWLISGKTKAQIEELHHNLCEEVAQRSKQTLSVNGNLYTNVVPNSVDPEIMTLDEFFKYRMTFELDYSQDFFDCQIDMSDRPRVCYFNYEYGDKDQELSIFRFHILKNAEFSVGTSNSMVKKVRALRANGIEIELVGGVETIRAECWINQESKRTIEQYLFNYICGPGPLGKQGTLVWKDASVTNTFRKAILTSVSQEQSIGGTNASGSGAGVAKYSLEFQVSLQC